MVLRILEKSLDDRWEIYVQPFLNGCRPDFILLNPAAGIGVLEVKDWRFEPDRYAIRGDVGGNPGVYLYEDEGPVRLRNPLQQLLMYRDEIYDLYCPRLQRQSGVWPVLSAIVFPFATRAVVATFLSRLRERAMFEQSGSLIWGADDLEADALPALFTEMTQASSRLMNDDLANDFRSWLIEPEHAAEQREPLVFSRRQSRLTQERTPTGRRRIRGPAGSGKSLVLAARAARLAAEGKAVLVITFNITLTQYLRDLCARHPEGAPNRVTWLHFHEWCKRISHDLDFVRAYKNAWRQFGVDGLEEMPGVVEAQLRSQLADDRQRYDAILVDEGQDILPRWWDALSLTLNPGGEMLLVADVTQDTYGTARAWTEEAMTGAGFTGPWTELPVSHRLPPSLVPIATAFAERFLPVDLRIAPVAQGELDLAPCALRWIQTTRLAAPAICFNELLHTIRVDGMQNLAMSDFTILTDTVSDGRAIEKELRSANIRASTTFPEDPLNTREARRRKLAFRKSDGRVKITTFQSFKGWESRLLMLNITQARTAKDFHAIYTGLTRLKRHSLGSHLTVVCSAEELRDFGRQWPEFVDTGRTR